MKRHFLILSAILWLGACTLTPPAPKQTVVLSHFSFEQTVAKLTQAIEQKGMTVFTVIDHHAAAQKVGLNMQPSKVIVFGTPKAGTPLMVKDPLFALQLPLKVLITETNGQVQVAYTPTQNVVHDSKIAFSDVQNTLANAEKLIQKTVTASE